MGINLQSNILDWLSGDMPTPIPYQSFEKSWFHYLALFIVVMAAIIAVRYLKRGNPRRTQMFVLGAGLLLLGFEIYKQIIMNYAAGWDYQWYIFPFQFCSTPIYIATLAGLAKPGKFQTALYEFLASFGLFAGLAVMLYPNDVFVGTIGINVQTMVHHGTMMVMGIALLLTTIKFELKTIIRSVGVFLTLMLIAMVLNLSYNEWIHDGTFNMFFINDVYGNHIPLLSIVYEKAPYLVFLFTYAIGFSLVAVLMLEIGYLLTRKKTHPGNGHKSIFSKAS